ncbi:MAG: hypothetical protein ACFFBD_11425 [Candidatus Hodarchaeota archaeon]
MSEDDFFSLDELPPNKKKEFLRAIAIQKSGMMPHVESVAFELENTGYEVQRFIMEDAIRVTSSNPPEFTILLTPEEFSLFQKIYSLSTQWKILEVEGWAIGDLYFFHLILKHPELLKGILTFCYTNDLPPNWDIPEDGIIFRYEEKSSKKYITLVGYG